MSEAPQAFFSTDTAREPADIIALFVRRWQVEVTFAETRAHLGVETQRQWSDKVIAGITPALLSGSEMLFSTRRRTSPLERVQPVLDETPNFTDVQPDMLMGEVLA